MSLKENRSINEINNVFRQNFDQTIHSQSVIKAYEQGYHQLKSNSQNVVTSVGGLTNLGVSEALQNVIDKNSDSLSDNNVIELKSKLAILEKKYLHFDTKNLKTTAGLEGINNNFKNLLMDDEQFKTLYNQENAKAESYSPLGKQLVDYAEQRVNLGELIKVKIRKKKRARNWLITLVVIPIISVFSFRIGNPELFAQYAQTLLEFTNNVNK